MGDPATDLPDQVPVRWVWTSKMEQRGEFWVTSHFQVGLDRYNREIEDES